MSTAFFANHFNFVERENISVSDSQTAAGVSCLTCHRADFPVCELIGIDCQTAAIFGQ